MCYIFEKEMVRGPQKQCSQVSDIQIHKYEYTIRHYGTKNAPRENYHILSKIVKFLTNAFSQTRVGSPLTENHLVCLPLPSTLWKR